MPYRVFRDKNPIINLDSQFEEIIFSVGGYFKALAKIIEQGYGGAKVNQDGHQSEENKMSEDMSSEHKESKKQATYFALYALLEFVTNVQLYQDLGEESRQSREEQTLKLDKMTYRHVLICMVRTGLLQKIVQLPILIDVNSQGEEGIIRLCLKLLISLIFKG